MVEERIEFDPTTKKMIYAVLWAGVILLFLYGSYQKGYADGYSYVDSWHTAHKNNYCICYNETINRYEPQDVFDIELDIPFLIKK